MNCTIKKSINGNYTFTFYTKVSSNFSAGLCTTMLSHDEQQKIFNKVFRERDFSSEEFDSCYRAKNTIIDYGDNNVWSHYVTLTFDSRKCNRDNIQDLYLKVRQFCNNYRRRVDKNFRYLLVPEFHKDNLHIHFHGLFFFSPGNLDITGPFISYNKKSGRQFNYYRSERFFSKFGAITLEDISTSPLYVSAYITKYVTKNQKRIFGNSYCCSQGLQKSYKIAIDDFDTSFEIYNLITSSSLGLIPCNKNKFAFCYSLDSTAFNIVFGS